MTRRLSLRHATEVVDLQRRDPASGWALAFSPATPHRCQVSHVRQLDGDGQGERLERSVAKLGVPPQVNDTPQSVLARWLLSSRVVVHGELTYVVSVQPVLSRGRLVYTQVLTGDRTDLLGGGWIVDIILQTRPRDRRGDLALPPAPPVPVSACVITAVSSDEATDLADVATSQARLTAPPGTALDPRTAVTVLSSPLHGRWEVVGEPAARPDRVVALLVRRDV